jgi:cysteine desulfurase
MRHIYLDYNTTTPLAPEVQEAMVPFLAEFYGTANGTHWLARASAEAVEDARSRVASLIGATGEELLFTSGGTESANLAIKGMVLQQRPVAAHLVITAADHACVHDTARFLESWGCEVSIAPVTGQGVVTAAAIDALLRPETALVSVPHAAAEIGTLQPIRAIAEVCHRNEVPLHVDATQTVGKLPLAVDEMDVDLLSISGHKLYAPKGVGALYVRQGLLLEPLIHGPGHESGLRGGTQNVAGLVGFGRAATLARESVEELAPRLTKLRDRLFAGLCATLAQPLAVFGEKVQRLPNVVAIGFPGVAADDLLARATEVCGLPINASPLLTAMGVAPQEARGAIRLSVGRYTTDDEIDRAIAILSTAWESLRA